MAESYRRSWRAWRSRLMAMGLASATESYAASALYTTLASLLNIVWRIRWAKSCLVSTFDIEDVGDHLNSSDKLAFSRWWNENGKLECLGCCLRRRNDS